MIDAAQIQMPDKNTVVFKMMSENQAKAAGQTGQKGPIVHPLYLYGLPDVFIYPSKRMGPLVDFDPQNSPKLASLLTSVYSRQPIGTGPYTLDAWDAGVQMTFHARADYFRGKPVILNLVYYRCPMLCSIVTDGLTNSMSELKFDVGNEFDVLTVSFDPRDTPVEAAARRAKFVKRYGRPGAAEGWHFLTGSEPSIRALTDSVGFYYAYDSKIDQYAHGATLIILTPTGRISRYFYGFEYKPRDIRLGLVEATAGRIGSLTDAVLLMCYHYDPATGTYSRVAMNFVRAGGVATMLSLGGFIFLMIRRERRHGLTTPAPPEDPVRDQQR